MSVTEVMRLVEQLDIDQQMEVLEKTSVILRAKNDGLTDRQWEELMQQYRLSLAGEGERFEAYGILNELQARYHPN